MNIYDDESDTEAEATHLTFDQYTEYKKTCEDLINQAKAAAKLSEIPEFKQIVMDAYFDNEPKRLAGLMATGRLPEKEFQGCVQDIRSIGSMRAFLQDFITKGNIAQDELDNLEIAWNEAVTSGEMN